MKRTSEGSGIFNPLGNTVNSGLANIATPLNKATPIYLEVPIPLARHGKLTLLVSSFAEDNHDYETLYKTARRTSR
jgi:hypothetical protein